MAMNIISKEKKESRWIGLPTNSVQECEHIQVIRGEVGGCGSRCSYPEHRQKVIVAVCLCLSVTAQMQKVQYFR